MTSRTLIRWLLAAAWLAIAWPAAAQADPPARVGSLSRVEGSVVVAPAGDVEWSQAPLNRPVTPGDRLWTDPEARADVHLGTAVLHVASQTFVEVRVLDDALLHSVLHEGVLQARVRSLAAGELFQIDTPHLAFRALQAGSYRIDADAARRITRVAVRDGLATVSGRSGRTLTLYPGQQLEVAGTDLERVASVSFDEDEFDRWAALRDAREDQSLAARYVPLEIVGSSQLDAHGSWVQDAAYGVVWYPGTVAADWAPYRYGQWQWLRPWGWTWIDQAPWGFAPFHYGRWALIGSRWAWVPGRLGPKPVYAPALVAFVGGGTGGPLAVGSGEGIAWYPLAPGETWRPFFAASATYVRRANHSIAPTSARAEAHAYQHRLEAVTALRIEDFRSGLPVQRHWKHPQPLDLWRAQPLLPPAGGRAAAPAAATVAARGWTTQRSTPAVRPSVAPASMANTKRAQERPPRETAASHRHTSRASAAPRATALRAPAAAAAQAPQRQRQRGPQRELRPSSELQGGGHGRRHPGRVS